MHRYHMAQTMPMPEALTTLRKRNKDKSDIEEQLSLPHLEDASAETADRLSYTVRYSSPPRFGTVGNISSKLMSRDHLFQSAKDCTRNRQTSFFPRIPPTNTAEQDTKVLKKLSQSLNFSDSTATLNYPLQLPEARYKFMELQTLLDDMVEDVKIQEAEQNGSKVANPMLNHSIGTGQTRNRLTSTPINRSVSGFDAEANVDFDLVLSDLAHKAIEKMKIVKSFYGKRVAKMERSFRGRSEAMEQQSRQAHLMMDMYESSRPGLLARIHELSLERIGTSSNKLNSLYEDNTTQGLVSNDDRNMHDIDHTEEDDHFEGDEFVDEERDYYSMPEVSSTGSLGSFESQQSTKRVPNEVHPLLADLNIEEKVAAWMSQSGCNELMNEDIAEITELLELQLKEERRSSSERMEEMQKEMKILSKRLKKAMNINLELQSDLDDSLFDAQELEAELNPKSPKSSDTDSPKSPKHLGGGRGRSSSMNPFEESPPPRVRRAESGVSVDGTPQRSRTSSDANGRPSIMEMNRSRTSSQADTSTPSIVKSPALMSIGKSPSQKIKNKMF